MGEHLGRGAERVRATFSRTLSLVTTIRDLSTAERGLQPFNGEVSPLAFDLGLTTLDVIQPLL